MQKKKYIRYIETLPSVNLFPFLTFRVTSPTAWANAKFKSLLDFIDVAQLLSVEI